MKITNDVLKTFRYFPYNVRLKKLRCAAGYTQTEFAKKIGCNTTSISMWERGHAVPSDFALARIVECLGIPYEYFLDIDEERETRNAKKSNI